MCGATFIEKSRPGGEMADATDLKSVAAKACGFESRPGHFARSEITNSMEETNRKRKKIKKSSKKQLFFVTKHNKTQKGFVNL